MLLSCTYKKPYAGNTLISISFSDMISMTSERKTLLGGNLGNEVLIIQKRGTIIQL